MKKITVLGFALFFCLFFIGCSRITTPPVIPDNGGMDEYNPQFISLLNKLNTPLELLILLSTCHYKEHDFILGKKEIVLILVFLVVMF
jgi:hypothetical protein